MGNTVLPPGLSERDVAAIPARDREDAIQEAWLAHLEGRPPLSGAYTYVKKERLFRRRHCTGGGGDTAEEVTDAFAAGMDRAAIDTYRAERR